MTKNATKGLPALLGDARRALSMTQAELADLLGSCQHHYLPVLISQN